MLASSRSGAGPADCLLDQAPQRLFVEAPGATGCAATSEHQTATNATNNATINTMTRASDISPLPHRHRETAARWARRPKSGRQEGRERTPTTVRPQQLPTTATERQRIRTPAGRGRCGRSPLSAAQPFGARYVTLLLPTRLGSHTQQGQADPLPGRLRTLGRVLHRRRMARSSRSPCRATGRHPAAAGVGTGLTAHAARRLSRTTAVVLFGAVLGQRLIDHLAGQLGRISTAGEQRRPTAGAPPPHRCPMAASTRREINARARSRSAS